MIGQRAAAEIAVSESVLNAQAVTEFSSASN